MPSFVTVAELKAYPLPVKDAQWDKITDDQIELVIEAASQNIEDFLDRRVLSDDYIERIRGNGLGFLVLQNYPVTDIDSVDSVDNLNNETSWDTADFLINSNAGIIEWLQPGYYSFSKNNVWVVSYTAGYATVPSPIKHATMLQTVSMLQPLFRGGVNFGEVELIESVNEQIVDLLESYKRKRIG